MKKKKVLIATNLDSFIFKFLIPNLKWLHDNNYEIHIASNGDTVATDIPYCDKKFNVCFTRNIFNMDNFLSYKQMKNIIRENHYDLIHCHTPFGAAITRFAARKLQKKSKVKVIYTAHGFHFFKGSSKLSWLLFYNVEKWLAKYTDILITINKEDYDIATRKFKTSVRYLPGVGIDQDKFNFNMSEEEKIELRKSLGLTQDDIVLIYPAELSKRKNQIWLLETLKDYLHNHKNVKLLLPGNDILNGKCQKYVKDNKIENCQFLGFRKDIPKLLKISDISVSSSRQEGLPVNILEAMYEGLPIIATDCRGQRDLIINGENGYVVSLDNRDDFVDYLDVLLNDNNKRKDMGEKSREIINSYSLDKVIYGLEKIYKEVFK